MSEPETPLRGRRRRRAVGPPGALPGEEPRLDVDAADDEAPPPDDDERLLREVPPHHG